MKTKILLGIVLIITLGCLPATSRRCVTNPNGSQCCGLVVGSFGGPDKWATDNGYFTDEGLTVCYVTISSSVDQFNKLVNGTFDILSTSVDNAVWRRQNLGLNVSVIAGNDGNRGFYLVGNDITLQGWDSVAALSNKRIMVDSSNSGFVVGLRKILSDYKVTNYTLVEIGANRTPPLIAGHTPDGQTQYATMLGGTAPYLLAYPLVALARQLDSFCPVQGNGFVALASWMTNHTNQRDLYKFFRALIRSYKFQVNPANKHTILAFLMTSNNVNNNTATLIYNDFYINPASGLNPFLTVRKAGMRNLVRARIKLGVSPYPPVSVKDFITDRPGGMVDQSVLLQAQQSFGITNTYDSDPGILGCPTGNKGVVVSVPNKDPCQCHPH